MRMIAICMSVILLTSSNKAYSEKLFYSNGKSADGSVLVKSWKSMRYNKIEKQDEDFSCGSASVATILRSFYGLDVYEKDVLDEVEKIGKGFT